MGKSEELRVKSEESVCLGHNFYFVNSLRGSYSMNVNELLIEGRKYLLDSRD